MRRIGYLRVSTGEQTLDRQLDALRPVCDELFVEVLSAVSNNRPVYLKALRRLRAGDTLVVLDTDRAYRNARDALNELHRLEARGVTFSVLNFYMDTTTPEGRFALTVKLAADQLERETLSRRTREGLKAARARGVRLGRPPKLSNEQLTFARAMLAVPGSTKEIIAAQLGVGRWTLSRALSKLPS